MLNPSGSRAKVIGDKGNNAKGWSVIESTFKPCQQHHRETLFTLGNGYLGTRGTFEEGFLDDRPITLLNGLYDDVPVFSTELVNLPNWLPLLVKIDGQEFSLNCGRVLAYQRELNLQIGVLNRYICWRSPAGHTLEFNFGRFLSLADRHLAAIALEITSVDFSGEVEIIAGFHLEPSCEQALHWYVLQQGWDGDTVWLHNQTHHSKIDLGMAAKLQVRDIHNDRDIAVESIHVNVGDLLTPMLTARCHCHPGSKISAEKIVSIFTSTERENPSQSAREHLQSIPKYTTILAAHIAAWAEAWQSSDIYIEGDESAQLGVRYSLFQLLAAAPRQNERVSIPPKSLSGFVYRGHIFWDTEIFILPFFTYTQPNLAKSLLSYRYHTLPGARRKAEAAGYEGAMYAWESAATGDEVTPRWLENDRGERVRIWCGDIEVHISADIAYGIWQYWQATGDDIWMRDRGVEIILETAIFWQSRIHYYEEQKYYQVLDVIGPDENHDCVDNNAYTNLMVQWHLRAAVQVCYWLEAEYPHAWKYLSERLQVNSDRLQIWQQIASNLKINYHSQTGIIEQFDGFFQLEDINLGDYEHRTTSIQGLLGEEATNQIQILKQPDVLMSLYLLRHQFDRANIQANWDYYHPRTDHSYGSSLGPAIHAILAADLHLPNQAYNHFYRAACVDIENLRRNTEEGVHAATAGGVWQAVVFGFAGIRITPVGPIACPNLPAHWQRLKFRMQWQNQWYEFDICRDRIHNQPSPDVINTQIAV